MGNRRQLEPTHNGMMFDTGGKGFVVIKGEFFDPTAEVPVPAFPSVELRCDVVDRRKGAVGVAGRVATADQVEPTQVIPEKPVEGGATPTCVPSRKHYG